MLDKTMIFSLGDDKSKEDKNTQQDNIGCVCYRRVFRIHE